MNGSKREQKRLEAAEHVCRAVRKSWEYYLSERHYMNIALDWMLVWIANSPKAVCFADPVPVVKKRREIIA